ncbi:hypothetical protein EK904_005552 [Melospiza melodia maxima]|nr:hypothetical protein EK904_005552 [Melospiza melodia maxima]
MPGNLSPSRDLPALNPLPRLLISSRGSSWSDREPSLHLPVPDTFPGSSPGTLSDSMEDTSATSLLSPTIREGWLDKNPPQGSYIYQRRWVKLDPDYLRYFDSEKDTYSKRLIPVSSISRVSSVGDQKFEVVTNNRNFVFRAENDADRNEWIRTLQQIAEERKGKAAVRTSMSLATDSATEPADKSGFLELRGFKHKLFVVVAGDKVFLYKNAEDYRLGIGITYIEMNVGNVKEVDRRSFDLTTPYRIFSFSADSEQEKEEWVEAMQQSITEALSNSEVAERIWAVESNRFCADCGSHKPEWASINLCVVICKRCAALEDEGAKVGEYRQLLAALPPVNRATLKALINHLFRYGIHPLGISLSTVGSLVALGCGRALVLSLMSPARKGEESGAKLCLMPSIVSCMGVEQRGLGGLWGRNPDRVSHRVQCFSGENQMNTHNLAIVFGPTLFQTDGKDYKAGRVVEDLISHYVEIFNVNDQEMKKQQDEITAIMKMREASSSGTQQAGDFICTVYLEEKKTETEQHVKIPATMTAEELTFEILDRRKIVMKEKDYWSCFEVNEREEAERPLHYSEKVLPILHCLGTESYLVVKKQMSMENMLLYLGGWEAAGRRPGVRLLAELSRLLLPGVSSCFSSSVGAIGFSTGLLALLQALCAAVTTSDLAETQALLFCGASVTCDTGDPQCPTPLALAERSGQRLQMEFLLHNKTSEPPRLEMVCSEEKPYSVHLPSITHNGFLYKTPSMVKPISERKGPEEFSRRWCTLQDGVLSYYENDRNTVPNGEIRVEEIVCLVNNPLHAHGIESTFEVYTEADRLYLFGLESPASAREWLKSIAKSFVHPCAEELLALDFERLGRLHYKGGLTLERAQEGWFALVGSTLHVCSEDGRRQEPLQLRKLQELCEYPCPAGRTPWLGEGYLCCDTQADLREWFATFLQVQNGGALWPSERPRARVARPQQDARLGNISLIPLRGNESEMRNSVAAFATDPLTVSDLGALDAPHAGLHPPCIT